MERTISIERLYTLGNYKNIKFGNIIDGIPQELGLRPEVMGSLSFLLMVSVEADFRNYQKLNQEIGGLSLEESLEKLSDMRDDTYREIQDLITNGEIKDE